MSEITTAELLAKHPITEGLLPYQLERLATIASEARFEKNQVIFREGDEASQFFLLISGRVALEINVEGKPRRIQTLEEGDELGWSSVLQSSRKFFQARALEPVRALVFDGPRLLEVFSGDRALGYRFLSRILTVVAERLKSTQIQLLDMYSPAGAHGVRK